MSHAPRADAFGFFYVDKPVETRANRGEIIRPLPAIPENGWKPKPFPRLEKAKILGFDAETKDLDLLTKGPGVRRGAYMVGISVAVEDGETWYFPMRHEYGENLPVENVMRWAQDELTRPGQPKVGTNLLYDLDFMAEAGVNVAGPFYDIQVAEALLDEDADGYNLEAIAQRHLKRGKVSEALEEWIAEAYGTKDDFRANIWRAPSNLVGPYAEADAGLPLEILRKQLVRLKSEDLLQLWQVEAGLCEPLLAMRRRGVRVDLKKAASIDARLDKHLAESKAQLKSAAGFDVDVDTKEHLVKLFDGLGLVYPRTAPTSRHPDGQPSFVKEFLEHHPHPIAQMITSIRRWEKFKNTFIHGYIFNLHVNGRIHCMFNQTKTDDYGTVSGRLSSSLPNLQNIPIRDEIWGPLIRSIFLPDLGEDWYRFDWSQIEYRILVHLAQHKSAEAAREMYRDDPTTDFHLMVAGMTGLDRKPAKNINFGLVYGMGKEEMSRQLGVDLARGEELVNQYHEKLPFVREAYKAASNRASSVGYITTLLKRRRRFNLWQPRMGTGQIVGLPLGRATAEWGTQIKRAYTHKGLNGEVQGSAADLMKLFMYEYWKRQDLVNALGAPLLTVHDEQDNSVPRTKVAREAAREVKLLMETCLKLSVPIVADMERGPNWGETKK